MERIQENLKYQSMKNTPVAIVTGASRGIGHAISLELGRLGYHVACIARTMVSAGDRQGLDRLSELFASIKTDFLPVAGDIADIQQHRHWINQVHERFGRIDLLVNNAGVAPEKRTDILETRPESFDRLININLRGPFFLTQKVAGYMKEHQPEEKPPGRIVFITSVSAVASSTNRAEYCISKAGLSMASAVYANRLASEGIPVFEIRPGIIQTGMTAAVKEKYDRLIADGFIPQGRWGQTEDIAHAVRAIASGDFDYATGMVFEISGGMNIRRL